LRCTKAAPFREGTITPLPSFPDIELEGVTTMPVLILWAIPAIIFVGGGIYIIGHLH
jgi:hypothetical protein